MYVCICTHPNIESIYLYSYVCIYVCVYIYIYMHATFVYLHERCCRKKTPVAPGGPRDAEPFGAWMVSFDPVLTGAGADLAWGFPWENL